MMSFTSRAGVLSLAACAAGVALSADHALIGRASDATRASLWSPSSAVPAELPSPRRMQSLSVPLPDADSRGERRGGVAPRMRSLSVPLPAVDVADAPPAADIDLPPTVNGNVLPGVGSTTSVPPSATGTAPTDAPVSAVQIGSGMAGRQSMTLRASRGSFIQRQEGGGNTQILSVESTSGGTVSQHQSGSGNFQSMSIGVTDRRPGPVSGISIQ